MVFGVAKSAWAQTVDDVVALRTKYANPVFGDVLVWDLVQKLALVVDPSDENLGTTNQLPHALQVADAMAAHGIDDGDMLIAALTHGAPRAIEFALPTTGYAIKWL